MGGEKIQESEKEKQHCITVERVHLDGNDGQQKDTGSILDALSQRESNRGISGYYLHNPQARGKVLFYLYGGAFLGGDAKGNVHYGIKLSQQCNMDVFIPQYGLLPEYHFLDALEDVIRAYVYLIETRRRGGVHPKNVILFGISSGGGLVVRLLQRIVEQQQQVRNTSKNNTPKIIEHMNGCAGQEEHEHEHEDEDEEDFLLQVPNGAVLMSPFVDYTTPKGSFKEYTVHDLIVNEAVFEEGVPYFATLGNDKARHDESPINRPLAGLPPLCIIVSEHECCYDQNVVLCNRARKEGVKVDLGVWKYMCHVWPVLTAFLPEARSAIDFVCEWIVEHQHVEND